MVIEGFKRSKYRNTEILGMLHGPNRTFKNIENLQKLFSNYMIYLGADTSNPGFYGFHISRDSPYVVRMVFFRLTRISMEVKNEVLSKKLIEKRWPGPKKVALGFSKSAFPDWTSLQVLANLLKKRCRMVSGWPGLMETWAVPAPPRNRPFRGPGGPF